MQLQDQIESYKVTWGVGRILEEIRKYPEKKLTSQQKNFLRVQEFDAEVMNGGLFIYFFNYGEHAQRAVVALSEVGATRSAALLQSAIDEWPNQQVPSSQAERKEILDKIDPEHTHWGEIDQKIFAQTENLTMLCLRYAKENSILKFKLTRPFARLFNYISDEITLRKTSSKLKSLR